MVRHANLLPRFPRSISARLVERFIFNFRLSPNSLAEKLPVPWLKPQIVNGWSVTSFCVLKVEKLMLRPVPSQIGLETICCAYRCGVLDHTIDAPAPSVYILGRHTDRSFISHMAPSIFESEMPPISAIIDHKAGSCAIDVRSGDGKPMFRAALFHTGTKRNLGSKAFASLQDFVDFIKNGVSSYAKSTTANEYCRIDLYKEDTAYESMNAAVQYNQLDYDWRNAGLEYDSAIRAGGGGLYVWTFKGRMPACLRENSSVLQMS